MVNYRNIKNAVCIIAYLPVFLVIMDIVAIRDCAKIIRRGGAEKLEGGGALHKIAAKIGWAQSKITHLTEGGP